MVERWPIDRSLQRFDSFHSPLSDIPLIDHVFNESIVHLYGGNMNQEELSKVKQDMERLVADVKNLMQSSTPSCGASDERAVCPSKCGMRGHRLMCLGLVALLGGAVGAMLAHKQSN